MRHLTAMYIPEIGGVVRIQARIENLELWGLFQGTPDVQIKRFPWMNVPHWLGTRSMNRLGQGFHSWSSYEFLNGATIILGRWDDPPESLALELFDKPGWRKADFWFEARDEWEPISTVLWDMGEPCCFIVEKVLELLHRERSIAA